MENNDIGSHLQLEVSHDKMQATIRVPAALASSIRLEDITSLLNRHKIKFGYDPAKVLGQLDELRRSPNDIALRTLKVARGLPEVPAQDGRIELLIQESSKVLLDSSGRADFRNIKRFKQIKKDSLLARRIPSIPGKEGCNIYGKATHPSKPTDPKLVCGENVIFLEEKNEYRSTEKGIFIRKGNEISISPTLYIPGNAGLESGNLVYDGNIHIKGNIERGALLSAMEELHVEGFVESSSIRVGRSFHVQKGINAQDKETIYVEEDLEATYLDNTKIVVFGNINVMRSINASTIMAHGNVKMSGQRSTIVGGTLHLFGSLEAAYIGNSNDTPTKIIIGIHHANERYHKIYAKELKDATKRHEKLEAKVLEYKKQLTRTRDTSPEAKQKLYDCHEKYKSCTKLIQDLKEQVQRYNKNILNPKPVSITVRNTIYSGVQYSYKGEIYNTKAPLHRTVIEFSPERKEPKFSPYQEKSE